MKQKSPQTFISKMLEYLLLHIFLITAITNYSLVSQANSERQFKKEQLIEIETKTKKLTDSYSWLRDPRLQKVFNITSKNLNFFQFLSPKQKELFKKKSADLNLELSKTEKVKDPQAPSTIAEVSRTYLLIYALAIVAIIKEDTKRFYITEKLQPEETSKKLFEAISEIVNSGEIFTALISAGATHKVLSKPLQFLQFLIQDTKTAPLFKNFMIHFTHVLVSFTGWEFGTQLWKEAANLLDFQIQNETQKEMLKDRNKVFSLVFKSLTPNSLSENPEKTKAARFILLQTLENIAKIIFVDSEMRVQWIYNTIRLRMANGNFATLVTSMASATAIGTTIFPGAGTLLGLTFGFAGGVATIFIPEKNKNQITVAIKDKWSQVLDKIEGSSTSAFLSMGFKPDLSSHINSSITVDDVLLDRSSYREKLVDIYIERVYYNNSILNQNNEHLKKYFPQYKSAPSNAKLYSEIQSLSAQNFEHYAAIVQSLKEIVSLYLGEAQLFDKYKKNNNSVIAEKFESQKIHNENLLTHFCTFSQSLLSLDYLNLKSKLNYEDSDLDKLQSMCKFKLSANHHYYESLPPVEKENFNSALRFLDKTYWSKFNEIATSSERLDEILIPTF